MRESSDILISVQSRFVDSMLSGAKRVELRRRAPQVKSGTRVWIYDKAPTAAVKAMAVLSSIETASPHEVWSRHNCSLGLEAVEFDKYVGDSRTVSALLLDHVHPLREPVSLAALRAITARFQPPQFYLKLRQTSAVLERLVAEVDCPCDLCLLPLA